MTHVLQDLGFTVVPVGEELHGSASITPHMWLPGTSVLRASILAMWTDVLTGLLAVDAVAPRVPVTLQLEVHLYQPPAEVTRVRAVGRRVKVGRTVVVSGADFTDEGGEPLATGTGLFMASPDQSRTMPPPPSDEELVELAPSLRVPLADRAGCERLAPGVAAVVRRDDGLNASGSVNGGLLALAVEEAAVSVQPGATLAMMTMRYLRPVHVGPAVATATSRGGLGQVSVTDSGRNDVLAVVATTRAFAPGS